MRISETAIKAAVAPGFLVAPVFLFLLFCDYFSCDLVSLGLFGDGEEEEKKASRISILGDSKSILTARFGPRVFKPLSTAGKGLIFIKSNMRQM